MSWQGRPSAAVGKGYELTAEDRQQIAVTVARLVTLVAATQRLVRADPDPRWRDWEHMLASTGIDAANVFKLMGELPEREYGDRFDLATAAKDILLAEFERMTGTRFHSA